MIFWGVWADPQPPNATLAENACESYERRACRTQLSRTSSTWPSPRSSGISTKALLKRTGHGLGPGGRIQRTSNGSVPPSRHGKTPTPRSGNVSEKLEVTGTPRRTGRPSGREPSLSGLTCERLPSVLTGVGVLARDATSTTPSCSPSTTSTAERIIAPTAAPLAMSTGCFRNSGTRPSINCSAGPATSPSPTVWSVRSLERTTKPKVPVEF